MNDEYLELLRAFPPRPITSDEQQDETQKVINRIIDKETMTEDERQYISVLGSLIYEYEELQESNPGTYGLNLLKELMEEKGLEQKDLIPIFRTASIASEILSGKRNLTKRHILELSRYFDLSPSLFFPTEFLWSGKS